jgi:hypothetical protein
MNAYEVEQGTATTLELKPEAGQDFGKKIQIRTAAELTFIEGAEGAYLMVGDDQWAVVGEGPRHAAALNLLRESKPPMLSWIAAAYPRKEISRSITLHVKVFRAKHTWPDRVDIGIDDEILRLARKKVAEIKDADGLREYLTNHFLLAVPRSNDVFRAVISASPNAELAPQNPFRLYGRGIALDVVTNHEQKLVAKKLVEAKTNLTASEKRPILLAEGKFRFCDVTFAGVIRGTAGVELERITNEEGSYFKIWQQYHELEWRRVLTRAQEFGWLHYRNSEYLGENVWRFFLSEADRARQSTGYLAEGEETQLEADKVVPREICQPESSQPTGQDGKPVQVRRFMGSCIYQEPSGQWMDVRSSRDDEIRPPGEGFLFISLTGDQRRLLRRDKAKAAIWSMDNGMPTLAWLLERKIAKTRNVRNYKALSPAALASFKCEPNERQKKALSIALNTPDIAVIQGPPGTGKTEVIAALQARLSEIEGEGRNTSGHILLTSYQHDAVEYAASKTQVYGLPTIKIGRKWGTSDNTDHIESWRRTQAEKIRATLTHVTEIPLTCALRKVRHLAAAYSVAPSRSDDPVSLIESVLEIARPHLSGHLTNRLSLLLEELKTKQQVTIDDCEAAQVLQIVRSIRTSSAEFSDDGAITARKALAWLKTLEILAPEHEALLGRAASWDADETPPFLQELETLRGTLLDRLLPNDRRVGMPLANQDVSDVLSEVVMELDGKLRKTLPGSDAVLYDFLGDLEHNPDEVKRALLNYTAVLAATCSQAAGYKMSQVKGESNQFYSVLVDEAARANPLDLCIPLAMAERRIVLVGDHRQLPHMLEPDIEHDLETTLAEGVTNNLKQSLFQRLFESLQEQELHDGIKRTITLNVQYRMHPVLGAFVSKSFYPPGEGFESGLPESNFRHGLTNFRTKHGEAVAAWMNVPLSRGKEASGKSKSRLSEARQIAGLAHEIVTARPDLSVGIISFYAAQVTEILRAFVPLGFAKEEVDTGLVLRDEWRNMPLDDGRVQERLSVGTVDAFQGKQFDVVILSMTRSNQLPDHDELTCRRKYGHLMFPNRCCVAMSRQKKLLVVAGDAGMLEGPVAAKAIPSLVQFRELCRSNHGILL